MRFYHVSIDLDLKEKEFIPRVPIATCINEDTNIKRICVCETIQDAISAFPYKKYFVNEHMRLFASSYMTVYKFDTDGYVPNKDVQKLVPDAHLTNEIWLKNNIKAKPEIIKITKLKLSGYNQYTNTYSGFVKELEYEKAIEDRNREIEFTILSKRTYNKFVKAALKNNIKIKIIEDTHKKLENYYWQPTTKNYRYIKLKAYIPSGESIAELWLIDDEQNNFITRKRISLKKYND